MSYVRLIMLIMMLVLAVGCKERASEVAPASTESAAAEKVEHPLPPSKLGRSHRSVEIRRTAEGVRNVLVDGKNLPDAVQIIAAGVVGKISGAGTGTEIFVGLDNSTTRATVTVDSSGNRSAVTFVP